MSIKTYTYGTKPPMEEDPDIRLVRNFATLDLNEKGNHVHITKHALEQANKRKIRVKNAVEIIAEGYFVEYQSVPKEKNKPDVTVFYEGHKTKILSVNSVADIPKQLITLITVQHRDDNTWEIIDEYIRRR